MKVSILDYGAGNVRSVRNAVSALGHDLEDVSSPQQILDAQVLIFPGVGAFKTAMDVLKQRGYDIALRQYLQDNKPFLGICLGMQTLFGASEEVLDDNDNDDADPTTSSSSAPNKRTIPGLGIIPGNVVKFDATQLSVPHIGWNGRSIHQASPVFKYVSQEELAYFVHSYYAPITVENQDWVLSSTTYGNQVFVSAIQCGNVVATQFHPEKSGATGLRFLKGFLEAAEQGTLSQTTRLTTTTTTVADGSSPTSGTPTLVKRIVVALDVRTNDHGDLVVTKGDQYDVRERTNDDGNSTKDGADDDKDDEDSTADDAPNGPGGGGAKKGRVRNLGKPVALASRYYQEGADEIAFLNITSYRQGVIEDMPMLHVLEEASKNIFVPLTVGGGIRSYTDPNTNTTWSALEVASRYFRAGADKVSLGSDAVHASESYVASNGTKTGSSSIEQISKVYGVQAVVVSIDPKRVYAKSPTDVDPKHQLVELDDANAGPNGERYCWYQCTVQGGRQPRDICAVTVAKSVEALGAGEIMLNCIDMDGQGNGFDLPLMNAVTSAVSIPVIASSGAGISEHFTEVFTRTRVEAALAAGMFHRKEVEIEAVKDHMIAHGIPARTTSHSSS